VVGRKGNGKGSGFDCIPNGKGGYDILNGEKTELEIEDDECTA